MKSLAMAAWAIAVTSGCTQFEDGDDRLSVMSFTSEPGSDQGMQTGSAGADSSDPWSCLDSLVSPGVDLVQGEAGDQVTLRIRYHDAGSQAPIGEATQIRVCNLAEIDCATPVQDWAPLPSTGEFVTLLPWGFTGYLEVQSDGYMQQITLLDTPLYRDLELYSHQLVSQALLSAFGAALDVPVDLTRSLVGAAALDCNGAFAPGVTVTTNLENLGLSYVTTQGIPTTDSFLTTRDGTIGFANATPGLVRISAFAPDGRKFDEQTYILRSGTHTLSYLRPVIHSVSELCGAGESLPQPGTVASYGAILACPD